MAIIINPNRAPKALINLASSRTYDAGDSDYTATSLIEEPRIRILNRRHGSTVEKDPYANPWAYISLSLHKMHEVAATEDQIAEQRIFTTFEGKKISGAMDVQTISTDDDFGKEVVIGDYKLTTVYAIKDVKKWEQQLNIYAWLVERNDPSIRVKRLEIYAFLRDWKISQSESYKNYPSQPGITIDIPLWCFTKREEFVRERIAIQEAAEAGELPECSHESRWPIGENFKVVKTGTTRAIAGHSKFKSMEDAQSAMWALNNPEDHEVVHVFSGYRRCQSYCDISNHCDQWKETQENNEG